jgi:DNA-binding transcriptional LysR family regulator
MLLRRICGKEGFEPNIIQRTFQVQTAVSLVSAGLGVALVPVSTENFLQKGVVYRRLAEPHLTELLVAYREDEISPTAHNFLDTMREVLREGFRY